MTKKLESLITYSESQSFGELFPMFNEIRKIREISDLVIKLKDGSKIYAHSIVLAARIPFLREYFKQNDGRKAVHWSTYEYDPVKAIVDFAYTGKCTLTEQSVYKVMLIAKAFQVKPIVKWCKQFITDRITLENLTTVWHFSNLLGETYFDDRCANIMLKNFQAISKTPLFNELDSEFLLELLKMDNLPVQREKEVFKYILQWIDNAPEHRSIHMRKMIFSLRWNHLTWEFIEHEILENQYVKDDPTCRENVITVLKFLKDPTQPLQNNHAFEFKPRHHSQNVYVLREPFKDETDACVLRYDPFLREVFVVGRMANSMHRAVTVLGAILYAVGGRVDGQPTLLVNRFSLRNETKMTSTRMSQEREFPGVAAAHNTMFVCGGLGKENKILSTCEVYSPDTERWDPAIEMTYAKMAHAVVAISEKQFAIIGGLIIFNEYLVPTYMAEQVDLETSIIKPLPNMNSARCFHGASLFNDALFVAGGYDSISCVDSIEILYLNQNAWSTLKKNLQTKMPVKSILYEFNSIYIFGYHGEVDEIRKEDGWKVLPQGRLGISPFVVEGAAFYK